MKRIISGMTYNTETSDLVARSEWVDDSERVEVTVVSNLYRTRGGAFFLVHTKEKDVWNEREQRHVNKQWTEFEPMSADTAQAWLMEDAEVLSNPFDDPPEAAAEAEAGATLYLRVSRHLKRRVEERAAEEGVSANAWAMRCLERGLSAKSLNA